MQRRAYLSAVTGLVTVTTAGCSALGLGTGDPPAEDEVSARTHDRINEVRREHDLSTLAYDEDLEAIAASHSADMADTGYFGHVGPDGETRADRYEKFGYDCRVPVGEDGYATGGENIWNVNYSGRSFSAAEIADFAVAEWMDSPDHRENILRDFWRREGLGVAIREDDNEVRLFLTQNFC